MQTCEDPHPEASLTGAGVTVSQAKLRGPPPQAGDSVLLISASDLLPLPQHPDLSEGQKGAAIVLGSFPGAALAPPGGGKAWTC